MTIKYKDLSGSYYPNFNEKNSNTLSLTERRAATLLSKSIGCTLLSGSPNPVSDWSTRKRISKRNIDDNWNKIEPSKVFKSN